MFQIQLKYLITLVGFILKKNPFPPIAAYWEPLKFLNSILASLFLLMY